MSTRCQLRFTDAESDRVAQVYRHSDGYPESVLSNLEHLRDLLHATGAQRDASYTAAQFIFIDKLWRLERTFRSQNGTYSDLPETVAEVLEVEEWEENRVPPPYLLGHGVQDPSQGINGDEEFLYLIELPADQSNEWHIHIAGKEDFPRWDAEDTNQAFEVADWGFTGTLETAIDELD